MGSDGNAKAVIVEKARKKSDAKKRNQQVCALSNFPPSFSAEGPWERKRTLRPLGKRGSPRFHHIMVMVKNLRYSRPPCLVPSSCLTSATSREVPASSLLAERLCSTFHLLQLSLAWPDGCLRRSVQSRVSSAIGDRQFVQGPRKHRVATCFER